MLSCEELIEICEFLIVYLYNSSAVNVNIVTSAYDVLNSVEWSLFINTFSKK